MLGLSWTELLVVGIVALIVIGPKDLPVVMGRIGKVVGQIQRMGREFQREINKTTGLDEVRNLRASITDPLKKTADEIRREFNAIGKDGQQTPTGALKPTDPKVESVADAIKEQAGMAPAKTSSELATDYGFKPSVAAKPVMGVKSTPPSYADLQAVKAAEAEAAAKPKAVAKPKTAAKSKAVAAKPVAAAKAPAKPKTAAKPKTVKLPEEPQMAAPAAEPSAKPARKPRAAKAAKPAEVVATEKAAAAPKAPRAPRKKPAETAEKS